MMSRMERIAQAFPDTGWANNPRSPKRKSNQQIIDNLTEQHFEAKFAEFRNRRISNTKIEEWEAPTQRSAVGGAVVTLTEEDYEAIFMAFPNLRHYKHEVRTMQAAHRKLRGIAPLTKNDVQQLATELPHIYGPRGKEYIEKVLTKTSDGTEIAIERQVLDERKQARNTVLLAPREVIAAAVARCRKVGALDGTPLSPKVEEWSAYTVGMVYAAIEEAHG
jgi:hypothetical protein